MRIVAEISSIFNKNVHMMNEKGIIIASTDVGRIGNFHGGAFEIVSKGMDELIIYDDHTYEGSRKGIALPLMLEGKVAGVIGIAGEHDDVAKYVYIVKKMTEILLLENFLEEQKKIDTQITDRFISDWIFSDRETYKKEFIERGLKLGIDITLPRRVIAAEIEQKEKYQDTQEGQVVIDSVTRTVRETLGFQKNSIFMKTASQMIGLIQDCDDGYARQFAEGLFKTIFQEHKLNLHIGIDKRGLLPNKAYIKAHKALNACKSASKSVVFYEDINIEIFADEVSPQSKKEFTDKVFSGLSARETAEMIEFLKAYFDMNGSLREIAEKLYIHKNTVQYKLNKLSDVTGYDPRDLSDAALFYIALYFYENP